MDQGLHTAQERHLTGGEPGFAVWLLDLLKVTEPVYTDVAIGGFSGLVPTGQHWLFDGLANGHDYDLKTRRFFSASQTGITGAWLRTLAFSFHYL